MTCHHPLEGGVELGLGTGVRTILKGLKDISLSVSYVRQPYRKTFHKVYEYLKPTPKCLFMISLGGK